MILLPKFVLQAGKEETSKVEEELALLENEVKFYLTIQEVFSGRDQKVNCPCIMSYSRVLPSSGINVNFWKFHFTPAKFLRNYISCEREAGKFTIGVRITSLNFLRYVNGSKVVNQD